MPDHRIPEQTDLPYRLGRHVNHDPRSRAFPFAARPEADVPIVSRAWPRRVPVFDQGSLGSCTGNAAVGWVVTDNFLRLGLTETPNLVGEPTISQVDAVYVYSQATEIDPWPGTYPPNDTGSDGLSVTKVLKTRGFVDTYAHTFTLDEALRALMSGPVLLGTNWYDSMFYPDAEGFVAPGGSIAGGHEILLTEVRVEDSSVAFANSWGAGWGVGGYGRMTYATLERLLGEDGDIVVPHALVPVDPPPPPPPPVPEPAGCLPAGLRRLGARVRGLFH